MGYSFGWNTRKELIEYLTKDWESPSEKTSVIAHSASGSILWTVNERTQKDTGEKHTWIGCCIIKGSGGLSGDWGYKGMEESMHPYYYSCPLSYLETAEEVCPEWREKVRQYWAGKKEAREKSKALTPGTKIRLPECWNVREFTLIEKVKQTWRAYGADGRRYKLPLKAIQQAEILPAA